MGLGAVGVGDGEKVGVAVGMKVGVGVNGKNGVGVAVGGAVGVGGCSGTAAPRGAHPVPRSPTRASTPTITFRIKFPLNRERGSAPQFGIGIRWGVNPLRRVSRRTAELTIPLC